MMRLGVNPVLRWDQQVTGKKPSLTEFFARARHNDVPSSFLNSNNSTAKVSATANVPDKAENDQSRFPNSSMANSDHRAPSDWSTPDETVTESEFTMARVPLIGRLFWFEYLALFGSLILVLLETIIHLITFCLPTPIIRFCYDSSKALFNTLFPTETREKRSPEEIFAGSVAEASDFTDICALFGYEAEEHIVQTGDGYLLGLHRLAYRKGEEGMRVNQGPDGLKKKVVYLHHGLLMCSEVWVALTDEQRCLPFQLVEKGYDVWLGNNRGNKYAKKSVHHSPGSNEFWDFSIDQFAFHDIPNSIEYILEVTGQPSLSYIGFSQGTAQAFATLSIHPLLNQKIDVFVALAPAMAPSGLRNRIVDSLMKASPDFLFLLFGRRSILSSTTMWQTILYPPIYVRIIDTALAALFNWRCRNITRTQKLAAYLHLYSFTSTKSVVHWFQIIRNRNFQFYDDELYAPFSVAASERFYKPVKYPTRNIKTPIVLLYGDSDSLVDINVMLQGLPRGTVAKAIPTYEHLDFLWASDVDRQVFGHVFDALETHSRDLDVPEASPANLKLLDGRPSIDGRVSNTSVQRTPVKDVAFNGTR